jgi:hypothetical protein
MKITTAGYTALHRAVDRHRYNETHDGVEFDASPVAMLLSQGAIIDGTAAYANHRFLRRGTGAPAAQKALMLVATNGHAQAVATLLTTTPAAKPLPAYFANLSSKVQQGRADATDIARRRALIYNFVERFSPLLLLSQ